MKTPKRKRAVSILQSMLLLAIGVLLVTGPRWADKHVRYITGGQPGPANCLPCHVHINKNAFVEHFLKKSYLSPLDVVVSADGSRLYVTAEEANALLVVSVTESRILAEIAVGKRPHSVVLSRDGKTAYVSNRWSDNVSVIDLKEQRIIETLETGSGPSGMALGPEDRTLYVANSFSHDISIFDLRSRLERKRLVTGSEPHAIALAPDGQTVYVTNRRANPTPSGIPPVSEVTVVHTGSQKVVLRKNLHSAHLLEGVAFTPTGDLALITLVKPKNLLPATQVGRGWMVTHGLGILECGNPGRVAQVLLDEPNAFFADPYDIAITRDGRRAFITNAGANCVTVVDVGGLRRLLDGATQDRLATYANHLGLSSRLVIARIATGANPKGLALSPDGRRLYVAERLEDRIAVIDTKLLKTVQTIPLGEPESESMVRRGQKLFNNADHAYQGQFSCRTCHPNADQDGLTYDFAPDGLGRNLVNTLSLRDIGKTAPYKWNGKNVSLYMQCGIRFAKFLTRTEPFAPDELNALVAYLLSLTNPPNRYRDRNADLTPAQRRGKAIYERIQTNDGRPIPAESRCITCHPPPYYTNRQKADVGTLAETDSPKEFDVPHLTNIYGSEPYLHDGRAATLEEIWTKYNPADKHGVANDLTKAQLNDLIEYLRVLGVEQK